MIAANPSQARPNSKSPEARRQDTFDYLQTLGISCPVDLPLLQQESHYKVRSAREIAERIVILANIYALPTERDEEKRQELLLKIKHLYWFKLSAYEKRMIETGNFRSADVLVIIMYPEIVHIWLWVLGETERIDVPTTAWDRVVARARFKEIVNNPEAFVQAAAMRPLTEILDVYDITYPLHVMVKEARWKRAPMTGGLILGPLTFRAVALHWLLHSDKDWDDTLYGVFYESYDALGNEIEYDDAAEDWDDDDPILVTPPVDGEPIPGLHGHEFMDFKLDGPSDLLRKVEGEE